MIILNQFKGDALYRKKLQELYKKIDNALNDEKYYEENQRQNVSAFRDRHFRFLFLNEDAYIIVSLYHTASDRLHLTATPQLCYEYVRKR